MNNNKYLKTDVLILGSGPSGYTSAFRCSDLGLKTTIIEKENKKIGGVCLNYGCIPSKSLIHFSKTLNDFNKFKKYGIFKNINIEDNINFDNLNTWKNRIISQLSHGLSKLSDIRNVNIIYNEGKFLDKNTFKLNDDSIIEFENFIISTGSESINLKINNINSNLIWDSKAALSIPFIPKKFLIIGAGIIGMEIASIYKSFGSEIDIFELNDKILPDIDDDLVNTFIKIVKNKINIFTNISVISFEEVEKKILVKFKNNIDNNISFNYYNAVLISIGRYPNVKNFGIDDLGIKLDDKGFIIVNNNFQTNIKNIYAIGDVIGFPMLAHKSAHEAKIVSEYIKYKKNIIKTNIIPNVIYSDPEISWVGVNENYLIKNKIDYDVSIFNWNALGKALIYDCEYGFTKLIYNKNNKRIIGGSSIGYNSSEILGEISLSIETCCNSEDISSIIHAHPTIYESINLSSSIYEGNITEVLNNRKKW